MDPAPLAAEEPVQSSSFEKRLYGSFERAETILTASVAVVLIGLAVLALVDTFVRVISPFLADQHDVTRAVTDGIDAAFLVIILLELLHTILSHGPISQQVQEFLDHRHHGCGAPRPWPGGQQHRSKCPGDRPCRELRRRPSARFGPLARPTAGIGGHRSR
jgi:hypothetical protein